VYNDVWIHLRTCRYLITNSRIDTITEEAYEKIPLVTSEVLCTAKGDDKCRFLMGHPSKIDEFLLNYIENHKIEKKDSQVISVASFLETRYAAFFKKRDSVQNRSALSSRRATCIRFAAPPLDV
jgi:hypothetical protein